MGLRSAKGKVFENLLEDSGPMEKRQSQMVKDKHIIPFPIDNNENGHQG